MTTEEYPGFATDLQAQYMALMTQAEGIALIVETIFENRFMHAQELARMGANIRIDGRQAIVAGPERADRRRRHRLRSARQRLAGAGRAGGQGETVIDRVYHIDRGYERIEEKLARRRSQDQARGLINAIAVHREELYRAGRHYPGTMSRWLTFALNPASTRFLRICSAIITERCCPPVHPNAMVR